MRRLVIPMMLYLSAAMLAAASYDDIVRTALSDSPDAVAAELSHEAGLLSVLEAELDDAYGFSVTMAASPLSDGMSAIDVSSLSFSMTAPDDDTSFTASMPCGVRYDGQGGSISPSASVEHVFDWGHDDEDLKDMQAAALRISVLREYLADRAAIRRNVLSLVTELLENERSAMEASLELDDASRELRDAVSLGIVTEGSIGFLELELARQRAEDSLRICGEEKEELMARYEAYLGAGWDGIEDIPMPVFPDVSGATTSSLLEEADMQRRIAEEEVLVTESAYNPMRMTAGAEAGGSIPLGQGLFSDASLNGRSASLYGSIGWEGNDFSVSAQGGGVWDDDLRFTPSLTVMGSWRSGNDESEDLALRSLRNEARIRASEAADARRTFEQERDSIANRIISWEREWSEMEAEIRYRTALAEMAETKLGRGMITEDDLRDTEAGLSMLLIDRDILLLEGQSLAAEAEALLL